MIDCVFALFVGRLSARAIALPKSVVCSSRYAEVARVVPLSLAKQILLFFDRSRSEAITMNDRSLTFEQLLDSPSGAAWTGRVPRALAAL